MKKRLDAIAREGETSRRLQSMPGVGPISALAVETFAPPMEQFERGRDFAARLGLVPRRAATGGKQRLGNTSKLGQRVNGADKVGQCDAVKSSQCAGER